MSKRRAGWRAQRIGTRAANDATLLDRVKLHVRSNGDCWEWIGTMTSTSPRVWWQGRPVNARVALFASLNDRPPDAYHVVPTCGNDMCVNPDHQRWETRQEFYQRARRLSELAVAERRGGVVT